MRRPFAFALAALLLAAAHAPALAAQDDDWEWEDDEEEEYREPVPTGGFLGFSLVTARTTGEFADYVDGGIGGEVEYVHRIDRDGWLALRADAGLLVYGYESYRVPFSNTVGGRVLVDVSTSNNMAFVGVGPQIGVPDGDFRPYVNGYVGWSVLWTSSSVTGDGWYDDEPIASSTNFSDVTPSYGWGAGVYVPLKGGASPVSLDLGVRYRNNGQAEYLREGDIQDNEDGTVTLFPVRSDTDLMTFHLGVSIGLTH